MSQLSTIDFPFEIPEVDQKRLIRHRYSGHLPDFDIYEPYVQYKIYPLIRENVVDVIERCKTSAPSDLLSVEGELIKLGRACALVSSLYFGSAIDRSNISESSDIVYADTYLYSIFLIINQVSSAKATSTRLINSWKKLFRADTSYLVLSPEMSIRNVQNAGWRVYQDYSTKADIVQERENLTKFLLSACRARVGGSLRPYHQHMDTQGKVLANGLARFSEECSAVDRKYIDLWQQTVIVAQDLLASRGIVFWEDY